MRDDRGDGWAADLPEATPEALSSWARFLQEDARRDGGTASVLLSLPGGGVAKVTACSAVVITELVDDPLEAGLERAAWLASLAGD